MRLAPLLPLITLTLAGCAPQKARLDAAAESGVATLEREYVAFARGYDEAFQLAYFDTPFAEGAVSVIAAERGELRTYRLTPCRQGTHICGSHAGHVTKDGVFTIVTGAYPGRTFLLAQGGDGALQLAGGTVPLAWEFTRDRTYEKAPAIQSAPGRN